MSKETQIVIRVTPEMKDELENIAKSYRRTLSNYLRILIENEINKSKGLPIFEL